MLHLADNLKLPTAIATQAISVLGIRGSGKTNTAGVIAEELLAIGQPVVVVDPTDAWWGLRSSADGKSAGFPILICGGPHGDLAIGENDGKPLAEFLVAEQVSAILSLRHLRKAGQRRFFTSLAEELYHLKGKPENRSALTLIIDEASSFVPQEVRSEVAASVGAVEDIINRGRNTGFGVVLINQRAASINKNALTQCDTLVIHRMPSPQDRKAIKEWIDENATGEQAAAVMGSMAKLETGEAWFWSPALDVCRRVNVRLKRTFDSSRTPKIGEAPRQPKKLAEIDLAALKGKMGAAIELAKANDPKLLKARIAELEKQLTTKGTKDTKAAGPTDQAAVDRAVAAAVKKAQFELAKEVANLRNRLHQAAKVLKQIGELATRTDFTPEVSRRGTEALGPLPDLLDCRGILKRDRPSAPPPKAAAAAAQSGGEVLGRMQRAFLTTLAQEGGPVPKGRLLALAGYAASGDVSKCFAQFALDGWAIAPLAGSLQITAAGLDALGPYDELPRGEELRQQRLASPLLSPFERKALAILFDAYPESVAKGRILEQAGYKASGDISKRFARLARMGWATKSGGGSLTAAELFFT